MSSAENGEPQDMILEIPHNHEQALEIDRRNRNNIWRKAIQRERQYRIHEQIML